MRAIDGKPKEFFENGASATPAKERPVRQIDDPENLLDSSETPVLT
jgi:hypothetical protein